MNRIQCFKIKKIFQKKYTRKIFPMRIEIVTSIIAVHEFALFLVTFRSVPRNERKFRKSELTRAVNLYLSAGFLHSHRAH